MRKSTDTVTVCYVLALAHSGSTALDRSLSSLQGVIGLGETKAYLGAKQRTAEGTEATCSCGQELSTCPFWGELSTVHANLLSRSEIKDAYTKVLEQVRATKNHVAVDSSKDLAYLEHVLSLARESAQVRIKVVFLVRDVRGWCLSTKRLAERSGRRGAFQHLRSLRVWLLRNKAYAEFLEQERVDYITVSYEAFALDHEQTIERIASFLGVPCNYRADGPNTHIAFGNRTKLAKRRAIVYDARWFHAYGLQLIYLLCLPAVWWNKKHVQPPHYERN